MSHALNSGPRRIRKAGLQSLKKDPGLWASEEVCCSPGTFTAYLALQSSVGLAVKIAEPTLIDIKDPICMGGIYVHRAALLNSSVSLMLSSWFHLLNKPPWHLFQKYVVSLFFFCSSSKPKNIYALKPEISLKVLKQLLKRRSLARMAFKDKAVISVSLLKESKSQLCDKCVLWMLFSWDQGSPMLLEQGVIHRESFFKKVLEYNSLWTIRCHPLTLAYGVRYNIQG